MLIHASSLTARSPTLQELQANRDLQRRPPGTQTSRQEKDSPCSGGKRQVSTDPPFPSHPSGPVVSRQACTSPLSLSGAATAPKPGPDPPFRLRVRANVAELGPGRVMDWSPGVSAAWPPDVAPQINAGA